MGLTDDFDALNDLVDDMDPKGNTNQAIGAALAWQTLTASPFTVPSYDPDYEYKKVIILLSDGMNTEDRWYSNSSSIDSRQEKVCDAIKDDGIEIYAIQVNTGHDPTSSVLQYCASDTDHFYELKHADDIVTAFDTIGKALSDLRISS